MKPNTMMLMRQTVLTSGVSFIRGSSQWHFHNYCSRCLVAAQNSIFIHFVRWTRTPGVTELISGSFEIMWMFVLGENKRWKSKESDAVILISPMVCLHVFFFSFPFFCIMKYKCQIRPYSWYFLEYKSLRSIRRTSQRIAKKERKKTYICFTS